MEKDKELIDKNDKKKTPRNKMKNKENKTLGITILIECVKEHNIQQGYYDRSFFHDD